MCLFVYKVPSEIIKKNINVSWLRPRRAVPVDWLIFRVIGMTSSLKYYRKRVFITVRKSPRILLFLYFWYTLTNNKLSLDLITVVTDLIIVVEPFVLSVASEMPHNWKV